MESGQSNPAPRPRILILDPDDREAERKEMDFRLDALLAMTVDERYERLRSMMAFAQELMAAGGRRDAATPRLVKRP